MRRRGISSECRRSSCSSYNYHQLIIEVYVLLYNLSLKLFSAQNYRFQLKWIPCVNDIFNCHFKMDFGQICCFLSSLWCYCGWFKSVCFAASAWSWRVHCICGAGRHQDRGRKHVNSLVPERCGCYLKLVIFTSRVDILSISCEIGLRWMPQDFTNE